MDMNHLVGFGEQARRLGGTVMAFFPVLQQREFQKALNRPDEVPMEQVECIGSFKMINRRNTFMFKIGSESTLIKLMSHIQLFYACQMSFRGMGILARRRGRIK